MDLLKSSKYKHYRRTNYQNSFIFESICRRLSSLLKIEIEIQIPFPVLEPKAKYHFYEKAKTVFSRGNGFISHWMLPLFLMEFISSVLLSFLEKNILLTLQYYQ